MDSILTKSSWLNELLSHSNAYVMLSVDVVHEPFDVEEVVSQVEPGVKYEHVDKDVFDELPNTELVLSASPIAVVGCLLVDLPHPEGGKCDDQEKTGDSHPKLSLHGVDSVGGLRNRIGVLEDCFIGKFSYIQQRSR